MSIAASALSEAGVAAQSAAAAPTTTKKPPKTRRLLARADAITQPEAR